MKFSIQTKLRLLLFVILLLGGALFGLFCWLIKMLQMWILLLFVAIFIYFILVEWLSEHSKSKPMKVFCNVISVPCICVFLIIELTKPFIAIIGTYLFVLVYGFGVPYLLLKSLNFLCNFGMLPETIGFIAIVVGSILCTNSYAVTKWIIRWSPIRNNGEHRYQIYIEKLAFYLIHPCNMVFMLYLVYFVLLSVTGYMQIQYGKSLISERYDSAILKAFLVFIAFTNMKTKAKTSDLDSQEIFKQIVKLFVRDDEEWLLQRFNGKKDSIQNEKE